MAYKLGSLFDGSGGFPLSGALCGIEPVWAAEVEPYPIAVTRSRFPSMKHLGDISKVNGANIEPVDIITFGSPCQDLSVAGKRAGLKHEANGDEETTRSGLFMEAVRIIKEMRAATNDLYPRFALWENVPGAFSSNKGEDFRIVCEELIKIVEPSAVMPAVPQKGWPYSDSYLGNGWSLAYRVFDAQYWGVPQRRRRIHLVVDFRGECAREILFERQGVRGYFAEGRTPWQAAPSHAEGSTGADDPERGSTGGRGEGEARDCGVRGRGRGRGRGQLDAVETPVIYTRGYGGNVSLDDIAPTLEARAGTGGNNQPCVAYTLKIRSGCDVDVYGKAAGKGALIQTEKSATLGTSQDQYLFQPTAYSFDSLASNSMKSSNPNSGCRATEVAKTLDTSDPNPSKNQGGIAVVEPVCCLQGNGIDRADTAGCNGKGVSEDVSYTLNTIDRHAVAFQTYQNVTGPLMANSHPGSYTGQDAFSDMLVAGAFCPETGGNDPSRSVAFQEELSPTLRAGFTPAAVCAGVDCRNATEIPDLTGALQAGAQRNVNSNNVVRVRYIVRRLTPTECARLQGFSDWWGHLEQKTGLTDEEYSFWLEVRNTHAAINGKAVKDYTKAQMLTWYNKLWTDGSEYKMWGNGIALPPALYCMQGISDALNKEEDDSWLM